jgi:hypothetical protein
MPGIPASAINVLTNETGVVYTGCARASQAAHWRSKLDDNLQKERTWSPLTMSKERTRDLGEDPRHGKNWVIPFQRLQPLVVEDRLHPEIAAATE